MVSRAGNQFNNAVSGNNLASVPKNMRQEAALMRTMKDDYKRVTISSYDYKGYKLPDQINIPTMPKDLEEKGYQYIAYSQKEQNESDKISYMLSQDYMENRYTIEQGGKVYEFNGTYTGVGPNKATNGALTIEEYMKQHPDAVFLGIGKFKETARIE